MKRITKAFSRVIRQEIFGEKYKFLLEDKKLVLTEAEMAVVARSGDAVKQVIARIIELEFQKYLDSVQDTNPEDQS